MLQRSPRRGLIERLAPLVCGVTSACIIASVWLAAKPTPTASVITVLGVFLLVLVGDLVAGLVTDSGGSTNLWQAASRIALAGATFGTALAASIAADLSLLLKTMACGAALVTVVRAASSEYESFILRFIALRGEPHSADVIASGFVRLRAWSLALATEAVILVLVVPRLKLEWFIGLEWPGAAFGILVVMPAAVAGGVALHDAGMRGLGRSHREPRQLTLELFPREPPPPSLSERVGALRSNWKRLCLEGSKYGIGLALAGSATDWEVHTGVMALPAVAKLAGDDGATVVFFAIMFVALFTFFGIVLATKELSDQAENWVSHRWGGASNHAKTGRTT
jgi:hypothetical protein